MRIASLFSGGKDSTFALYWAMCQGWDVPCLVTLKSANPESYMFQTATINLVKVSAKALGIPLILVDTLGHKEDELLDLKNALVQA